MSSLRKNLLPLAIFIAVFLALFGAEYARAAWVVDKDKPTTGIAVTCLGTPVPTNGTCGATTATVTMTCTDTPPAIGSGCLHIHYSANSGSWQTATSLANPLADTYVFPITLNSVPRAANVKAHSEDGAGNMECPHSDTGAATDPNCPIDFPFTFTGVSGWWQVTDGDVMAADLTGASANIKSLIPEGCSTLQCQPYLNLEGGGGYPGVVAYGKVPPSTETANFGIGTPLSKVAVNSAKRWLANSGYSGRKYDYEYFKKFVPPATFTDSSKIAAGSTISGGTLISGYQSGDGYTWRYAEGDLTYHGTANIDDRKLILIINGNFNIGDSNNNAQITVNKGTGFFAAIVKGNIIISGKVERSGSNPSLEGLYMANGVINTGTTQPGSNDNQLRIRGALIGWGGINFQRNLGDTENENKPGEKIEYAPDLLFTFPRELLREGIVWKEIAP